MRNWRGASGRGGTVMIVKTDHEARLYDKSPARFSMGLDGTRSGEQWFLGYGVSQLERQEIVNRDRGTNEVSSPWIAVKSTCTHQHVLLVEGD